MAEIANKANNPLSDVWILIGQNDTTLFGGDLVKGTKVLNSFKLQPVMPFPIFDQKWNLIFRPIINIVSSPIDKDVGKLFGASANQIVSNPGLASIAGDPFGRTSGLGDSVLLTLLGPNRDDGWIWGGGVTQIFPTATEDVLGQGKWQAGPTALGVYMGTKWKVGGLVQQYFSYAGKESRDDVSVMNLQYFVYYSLSDTMSIGAGPNIVASWEASSGDKWTVPLGIGINKTFQFGKLPVRFGIEYHYNVVRPDSVGADWDLRFMIIPAMPSALFSWM